MEVHAHARITSLKYRETPRSAQMCTRVHKQALVGGTSSLNIQASKVNDRELAQIQYGKLNTVILTRQLLHHRCVRKPVLNPGMVTRILRAARIHKMLFQANYPQFMDHKGDIILDLNA